MTRNNYLDQLKLISIFALVQSTSLKTKEPRSEHRGFCLLLFMPPPLDISYVNEPEREIKPTPSGWLVASARNFCLLFIRDPKSSMAFPTVFPQLLYCTEQGIPIKLKNTRRLDYLSSYETWNELISIGWKLVEHQMLLLSYQTITRHY